MRTDSRTDKGTFADQEVSGELIDLIFVVDVSGSMRDFNKIAGARAFVIRTCDALSVSGINYNYHLFEFGDRLPRHLGTGLDKVKLEASQLRVQGGTSFYDAVIHVINKYKDSGNKTIVYFISDGEDWHSSSTSAMARDSINTSPLLKKVFIGTQRDIAATIADLGINKDDTLLFDNTGEGLEKSSYVTTDSTIKYSKDILRGESMTNSFFSN